MTKIKLVKSDKKDLGQMAEILASSGYIISKKKHKILKNMENLFSRKDVKLFSYLLKVDNNYRGYFILAVKNKHSALKDMALDKRFHGKGLSKKLLEKAIAISEKEKCEYIELTAHRKNFRAIGLYNKYSFYVIDLLRNSQPDGEDTLRMRKDLSK